MRVSILIIIYTLHFAYLKVYTKSHNPKSSSCWENSDENRPHVLYRSDRRKKMKKEGKMSFCDLISIYTKYFAHLTVYTEIENTGFNRNREICNRNFHWRERKMNK